MLSSLFLVMKEMKSYGLVFRMFSAPRKKYIFKLAELEFSVIIVSLSFTAKAVSITIRQMFGSEKT